jgi:dTDP-4-amino-4,6-dideoxygalactose transaminase
MTISPTTLGSGRRVLAPWPYYDDDEIAAVTGIFRSGKVNYWTGDEGRLFEAEYAKACNVRHGLAVANGTVALELALYGLGIGPGDDVLVPARTFVATASAAVARGAHPVVCDIDPISQNLTAETAQAALTPRTKAIIVVHLAGWPADMEMLMAFARQYGLKVIEDCAQAHGAKHNGAPVGGLGDVGCFSFCQDKIITTGGEGGMVVTNDTAAFKRMWSYRDHGKDFARTQVADPTPGFKWLVDSFGTNWRLTEPQSAVGRIQLAKLEGWVDARRRNAGLIDGVLEGLNAVTVARPPARAMHAYYKHYSFIVPEALKTGWSRDRICSELEERGVPARVGACPDISREKAFSGPYAAQPPHPNAARIADTTVMLPVHPTLTREDVEFIAGATRDVIEQATR